jgi:hypothetical protein
MRSTELGTDVKWGRVPGLDMCVCARARALGCNIYKLYFDHKMCLWVPKKFQSKEITSLSSINRHIDRIRIFKYYLD